MKRSTALALVVVLTLAACGGPGATSGRVDSVAVTVAASTLPVGQTTTAMATVEAQGGAGTNVIWTSTNPTIAGVSQAGVVTALAEGTTGITATSTFDTTKTATASVTVTEAEPTGYTIVGQVGDLTGMPLPNTVSIFTVHPGAFGPSSSSIEYDGSVLAVASSPIDGNGVFELQFSEDIPAKYLVPAGQAIRLPPFVDDGNCALTASASTRVIRMWAYPAAMTLPNAVVGPLTDTLSHGFGYLFYTTLMDPSDFMTENFYVRTWTYAEAPVVISGSCTMDPGSGVVEAVQIHIELEAGWNAISNYTDQDEMLMYISNDAFDGSWMYYAP